MINPQFYDSQATLDQSRPCYIERQADRELLAAVLDGMSSLVLSSPKMGKSSLIERVFFSLQQQSVHFLVAKKELALVEKDVNVDQWCHGIARDLAWDAQSRCGFTVDPAWQHWWAREAYLPPMRRFFAFIREFLLNRSQARWVIAIDEIDTTIQFSFSDELFDFLRSGVNFQATDPVLRRLSFILAGVATPAQLKMDSNHIEFNNVRIISIGDFSPKEAAQLLPGLGIEPDDTSPALIAVLTWTGGHPFLTQRLFKDLASTLEERGVNDANEVTEWHSEVTRLVEQRYLRPGIDVTDDHFADIVHRRLKGYEIHGSGAQHAICNKRDDLPSEAVTQLKLSGLVKTEEDGTVVIRNLLYRRVLDLIRHASTADTLPAWLGL